MTKAKQVKSKEKPAPTILDESGKELAPSEPRQVRELREAPAHDSPETQAMSMISLAVADGRSVEEIGRLIEFKERLEEDHSRKAYNRAMSAFQAFCPAIPKTGRAKVTTKSGGSYEYSFPKLDVIMAHVRPHLARNGLSVTFSDFVLLDGAIELSCLIRHEAGHIERHPIKMPIDRLMSVNEMQKVGVANSYARRYAVVNALNLVGTEADNDAHDIEVERIDDAQLLNIRDWIDATEANEPKMLEFFSINRIEDLPARRYNEALNMLKARQKMLKEKAAEESES